MSHDPVEERLRARLRAAVVAYADGVSQVVAKMFPTPVLPKPDPDQQFREEMLNCRTSADEARLVVHLAESKPK